MRATLSRVSLVVALASLLALPLLVGAPPALAHQTSMKQLELRLAEPPSPAAPGAAGPAAPAAISTVELLLRASVDDVASAIGRDATPLSRAEVLADATTAIVLPSWVQLFAGAAPCPPVPGEAARASEDRDARFVAVRWRLACPAPIDALTLDLATFFRLDAAHTMVVHLEGRGAALDAVVGIDDSPLQLRLTEPGRSFGRWLRLGMSHIFGGADHVCFVLTLLIVVVLTRSRDGARPGPWQLRPAAQAARSAALLITSFSLAHSLTLITASLGWISLPGRLVETVIAISIAYAAIENAIRPDAPWRWGLTFGFGLIHGLGFASALRELLPADRVIVPLLAFNLGVEVGQLLIVAAVLPVLLWLARLLRAHRYRSRLVPLSSILLGLLALSWCLERAFELTFW